MNFYVCGWILGSTEYRVMVFDDEKSFYMLIVLKIPETHPGLPLLVNALLVVKQHLKNRPIMA